LALPLREQWGQLRRPALLGREFNKGAPQFYPGERRGGVRPGHPRTTWLDGRRDHLAVPRCGSARQSPP
jgi:hypothetical protein